MNRLFELLLMLMDEEKMTAKQIAEHFEISERTVYRDIDKLIVAGIPIETVQGFAGGISIDKSFRLSNHFLSTHEKEAIITGLKALDSIQDNSVVSLLTRKLFHNDLQEMTHIDIDLSSWYGTRLIPKIELLKNVLLHQCQASFLYYRKETLSERIVSPQQLVFRWGNWYLRAIDHHDHLCKLYKLNRMDSLQVIDMPAIIKEVPDDDTFFEQENYYLIADFEISARSQLVDAYGVGSFTEGDHKLHFERWFANQEYLISWILSFGAAVVVHEPLEIRDIVKKTIQSLHLLYELDI